MAPSRRIPIKQVAQMAGVSTQTVSRVTNNRPDVSPETRKRVLEIIDHLGYRPSRVARALRGAGRTLGVVGYGLELYGPSRALIGVEQQAKRLDYSVILEVLSDPEDFDAEQILYKLFESHVNGVVWCLSEINDNMRLVTEVAQASAIPIVFTDALAVPPLCGIMVDNRAGGRLAAQHLVEQGHHVIGIITGPLSYRSARDRLDGWRETLLASGLAADDDLVEEATWSASEGAAAFERLYVRRPDLTALFASNDQIALGAFATARRLGLRLPEQLAVVGFDDIPEAAFFQPALSSVRQDGTTLGAGAVDMLMDVIETQTRTGVIVPQNRWLQPQLVIRESSLRP